MNKDKELNEFIMAFDNHTHKRDLLVLKEIATRPKAVSEEVFYRAAPHSKKLC